MEETHFLHVCVRGLTADLAPAVQDRSRTVFLQRKIQQKMEGTNDHGIFWMLIAEPYPVKLCNLIAKQLDFTINTKQCSALFRAAQR